MIQTDTHYEMTDTFGGEANYGWVKRGVIAGTPGKDFSDLAAVRRVKAALDMQGVRCRVERDGESITLYPSGQCVVVFISFREHGACPMD